MLDWPAQEAELLCADTCATVWNHRVRSAMALQLRRALTWWCGTAARPHVQARNGVCDEGRGTWTTAVAPVLCDLATDCTDCGGAVLLPVK